MSWKKRPKRNVWEKSRGISQVVIVGRTVYITKPNGKVQQKTLKTKAEALKFAKDYMKKY